MESIFIADMTVGESDSYVDIVVQLSAPGFEDYFG